MPNFLMLALTAMLAFQEPTRNPDILAPYYPTPELIVQKMLEFGGLKPGETMFDLGSGDGRIVFAAAQNFHANAIGVELDNDLVRTSIERLHKLKLEKTARIIHGDLLKQDYTSADLVTVYLLPSTINDKVKPLLEKQLKKGARVVSHDFNFNGWKHTKYLTIDDDGEGRSHTLYLYVR
jgi:ubiquinone/menaquinone biosynthesis C-methylase UbiE